MRTLLLSIGCALSVFHCLGQGWVPAGSRSMSMGNASVCQNDVWAYHNNPGALGELETFSAGISYENRFLLRELQSQGLAVAIPLKMGVISVGGHMYGYSQFRSYKAGVGYGMKLADKFYAGVQMNYQGLQLSQNYGNKNALTAEAGLYGYIKDNWKVGVAVFNVGRTKLADFQDDRFSTTFRFGSSYHFSKKVLVSGEFEKSIDYQARFKAGVEYEVVSDFFIRGGVATTPIEVSFGAGYQFNVLQLGLGTSYHQVLGWSPHFSLTYSGKQTK